MHTTVFHHCLPVPQLFFHDPDNLMIEICNCELLPLVPACTVRTSSLDAHALQQLERLQQVCTLRQQPMLIKKCL